MKRAPPIPLLPLLARTQGRAIPSSAMLACPMGGPIFSTFTASGVRYSHHKLSNRVTCSQLQPVRFASRPQFALSPLAALFQTAARRSPSPMPRQSAPSPPERIPFPSGEDLHRDTPVIILPRAGPNLYGAEPHDSPLLPHTHTPTRAQVEDTFAFWKPGFSRTTPFLFSRFIGGEPSTLSGVSCCQDCHPPPPPAVPFPHSRPSKLQCPCVLLPLPLPRPPPASSPAQERPKCQCNNATQGYLIRAKRKKRKEQKSPKDRKRSKYLVQSMTCGASAESPTRRSASRARACSFSPAAVAARLSGAKVSIFARGGKGLDGARRRGCVMNRLVLGPNGCGCL